MIDVVIACICFGATLQIEKILFNINTSESENNIIGVTVVRIDN
jgi:hypothetical protein